MSGKARSEMSALQPYRGNPAVRNDRGDRGNVGIIEARSAPRSYPTAGGRSVMSVPTAISEMSAQTILLKSRADFGDSAESRNQRRFAFELRRCGLRPILDPRLYRLVIGDGCATRSPRRSLTFAQCFVGLGRGSRGIEPGH